MVIGRIYRRPKSGFVPAVSRVKTNNENACSAAFWLGDCRRRAVGGGIKQPQQEADPPAIVGGVWGG